MKEKVEMPNKSTVLAVARKCPDAKEVLKGLFPEAFEEKEVELRSGQIYKENDHEEYYLLLQDTNGKWKLVPFNRPSGSWNHWQSTESTKDEIKENFTLCPDATITVKENTSYSCCAELKIVKIPDDVEWQIQEGL